MTALQSKWVQFETIAYMSGKGLLVGSGPDTPLPRSAKDNGKYGINVDVLTPEIQGQARAFVDAPGNSLEMFATGAADWVFVGPRAAANGFQLPEILKRLKQGGHLILHARAGELQLPQHGSWKVKTHLQRDGQEVWVGRLLDYRSTLQYIHPASHGKRACICRYGAIGDLIMVTPLIEQLAKDGYEVTLNVTPYAALVLENNPYVKNVIVQERDAIPNPELGEYWRYWQNRYEKYINLSESIEGSLLRIETRKDFYTPRAVREAECSENYIDKTMRLGGYPEVVGASPALYLSKAEAKFAANFRGKIERQLQKQCFLIVWGLNGSSAHKVFPLTQMVLEEWLPQHPDARVVLVGDVRAQQLEFQHPQVIPLAGRESLRNVFALVRDAQLVVGPESAIVNAASCYDNVQKIVFLSHSNEENLTKYWKNTIALRPNVPCYPCHQLHYSQESCPLVNIEDAETQKVVGVVPACTMGHNPQQVAAALEQVYSSWKVGMV